MRGISIECGKVWVIKECVLLCILYLYQLYPYKHIRESLTFFAVAIDQMIRSKHRATKWRHHHCCLSIFSLFTTTLSFQWWYRRNTLSRIFFFRKCFKDVNVDIDGNNNIAIAILLLQYFEKVWQRPWIWLSCINGLFMDYHKLWVLVVLLLLLMF